MTNLSTTNYPGYISVSFVRGEDVEFSLEFYQDNGDPFNFTGISVESMILHRSSEKTLYSFDIATDENVLTFLLPKTVTTELIETSYLSALKMTNNNQVVTFPREARFLLLPQSYGDTG